MAQPQSHFSFSIILGILYAVAGSLWLNIGPEHLLLASVIVLIAGILPNVDAGDGAPAREFGAFIAAIFPIVLIQFFPVLKAGGVSRIALVVICGYIITRLIFVHSLQRFAVHRGMLHSIPAAIITSELVYLLFWDLHWMIRLYLATAALVGFLSHLLLDAGSNLDLAGRMMGKAQPQPRVLKLFGDSAMGTMTMYGSMLFLGWFIMRDFYPHIRIPSFHY